MPLRFDTRKAAEEGDEFSYIARVVKFREVDLTPEERANYGAEEGTDQYQLVVTLEGVSIEWVGDEGNLRTFYIKRTQPNGEPKKGRNNKGYQTLKHIIAPIDPEEATAAGFVDKLGNPEPGLGYDDAAANFPECLEGKIVKVAHRWVTFGIDQETKEPMRTMLPAFLEELPDDYVHEGKVSKVTYKGRQTTSREPGEAKASATVEDSDKTPGTVAVAAPPEDFFAAIDGKQLHLQTLHEAVQGNPGLTVDPYRKLYASKPGRQAMIDAGYVSVDESTPPVITVEDVPSFEDLEKLVATLKK